jgi:hypothetical protein
MAVDDVALGPAKRSVQSAGFLPGVADRQQVETAFSNEAAINVSINVDTHSQNGYSLFFHSVLHLDQGRKFFDAGRTPCGPEIQHHHLSAELTQNHLAVRILHREIWSHFPHTGRARTPVAAPQEEKGREEERKEKPPHPTYDAPAVPQIQSGSESVLTTGRGPFMIVGSLRGIHVHRYRRRSRTDRPH